MKMSSKRPPEIAPPVKIPEPNIYPPEIEPRPEQLPERPQPEIEPRPQEPEVIPGEEGDQTGSI